MVQPSVVGANGFAAGSSLPMTSNVLTAFREVTVVAYVVLSNGVEPVYTAGIDCSISI